MTGNNLGVIDIQTGEFGAFAGDELVARAVEAVLADAVFLVVLVGQGVHEVGCGKRLVERGVEYGYLFHAGKDFSMERIPSKLAGLCSGAIWNSERIFSWTCLVTRQLSGKNSPPCATR